MKDPQVNLPSNFDEVFNSTSPAIIHGLAPRKEGVFKEYKDTTPRGIPKKVMLHDFNDAPDKWFSLAPMYCALGDGFNLLADFSNSIEGKGAELSSYRVDYPIMPSLKEGANIVSGIDPEHFHYFRLFLAEVVFKKGGRFWIINEVVLDVKQPKIGTTFPLAVYTPVSHDTGVYAYTDLADGKIRFYPGEGSPLVEKFAELYGTKIQKGV